MLNRATRMAIKDGPLVGVYTRLRYWKRRLRGEPIIQSPEFVPVALTVEALLALASSFADSGLLCYSLGRGYLERETPTDTLHALACLRSAEALGFAARERARLFRALALAWLGGVEEARALVSALVPEEMTASEDALRLRILEGEVPRCETLPPEPPDLVAAHRVVQEIAPSSLIVMGGAERTALWLPTAAYLSLDVTVTGLTPRHAAEGSAGYQVGLVASASEQLAAEAAGVRCERWITWSGEQSGSS